MRHQRRARAHPRCGGRSLGPGVPAADHDDVLRSRVHAPFPYSIAKRRKRVIRSCQLSFGGSTRGDERHQDRG
jgi:hypothetical protein